jgi:two-component system, NtrC family, nitrogen regulation sensor histidine kinase NtrY
VTERVRFSVHIAVSAAVCGTLAFLACWLAVVQHLYFTSLAVVIVFAGFTLAWVHRLAMLDRSLASIIAGRAEEVAARSPLTKSALSDSLAALDARSANSTMDKIEHRQLTEQLEALVDTVPAALFALGGNGQLRPINRASRRLAAGLDALRDLRPGSRRIVELGASMRYLALATQFRAPGRETELLISVQRIEGELDIVEVEAWRNMARVLAHEMMNSLTPIVSVSESLASHIKRARLPGNDIPDAIEAIRRRSLGLLDFVQRYRQASELPKPELKAVKLRELVAGLDALMVRHFQERGVEFQSAVSNPDREIAVDSELLTHALINLLTNAIEAVSAVVQPTVALRVESTEDAVVFAVRDNGPGIRDDERDQIFVPFHTTKPGGAGIGLSLARQIAIAHGGKLEVQPTDPGCVFLLTI